MSCYRNDAVDCFGRCFSEHMRRRKGTELVTIHFEYGLNIAGALREGTACDLIFSRVIQELTGAPQDCFYDLSGEKVTGAWNNPGV
ncbi:MAG: hypothetical protein Q4B72_15430 [Lachnospiraceae bacterium]|nr:hypothetical protein [Lachnospiraceae bacterium]